VLVLTRDPVPERIASVVVSAVTRTRREVASELPLTAEHDADDARSRSNAKSVVNGALLLRREPAGELVEPRDVEGAKLLDEHTDALAGDVDLGAKRGGASAARGRPRAGGPPAPRRR